MNVGVVLPAGGAGTRMGGVPKAFLDLAGTPILARSLQPFLRRVDVAAVAVPLPPHLVDEPPHWLTVDPRVIVIAGGAERSDSVRFGVEVLPDDVAVILVHDAARPLVSNAVIDRCIAAAAAGRAVVAAVPVVDTLQQVDDEGRIMRTPDRRLLRAAQTPQAFPAAMLRRACARAARDGVSATDDAALVTYYGGAVFVVDGAYDNIKITTPTDLVLAAALLARASHSR